MIQVNENLLVNIEYDFFRQIESSILRNYIYTKNDVSYHPVKSETMLLYLVFANTENKKQDIFIEFDFKNFYTLYCFWQYVQYAKEYENISVPTELEKRIMKYFVK